MLHVAPKHWLSNDYIITQNNEPLTFFDMATFREAGEFTLNDGTYRMFRESPLGAFNLERNGATMAQAIKPSAFRSELILTYNGEEYTLKKESVWRRAFGLHQGDVQVGQMQPQSVWSQKAVANFPPDLPLPVQLFLIWLGLILWRRDQAAASSATTS